MKTDPENADYTVEKGASRNYEPWREKDRATAEAVAEREEEERGNAMKVCLEAVYHLRRISRPGGIPPIMCQTHQLHHSLWERNTGAK